MTDCLIIIKDIYKGLREAREAFTNSLLDSKPNLDAGMEFAYRYLLDKKEVNTRSWESFGIQIAAPNAEICVWDLFDVVFQPHTAPPDARTGGEAAPTSDLSILIMFCSIYRMGSIMDSSYKTTISDRIVTQAVGLPVTVPKPDSLISLSISWLGDPNYLKLIAGIDMFLHRFPKSSLAHVRVGTIPSRYRDCSSLLSVRFFLHIIGSDTPEHAAAWISYNPVAKDLVRMSKLKEEAANGDSYFPYQSDMGIVKKTAYSTVINPSYFFFVHGVGALLGLTRSKNARMTLEYGVAGTVCNVFWVAYVHKRNHEQTLQFTASGERLMNEGEGSDTEIDGLTIRSFSHIKWARFMEARKWALTDFMKETIKGMQQELIRSTPREGTIGAFLSTHSID